MNIITKWLQKRKDEHARRALVVEQEREKRIEELKTRMKIIRDQFAQIGFKHVEAVNWSPDGSSGGFHLFQDSKAYYVKVYRQGAHTVSLVK
jgi:hypothetical protein